MRRPLLALCLSTALGLTALPANAADAPVTPTAPVVVDECGLAKDTVTIPEIDGLSYFVELGGDTVELTPGSYAGIAFLDEEEFLGEGDYDPDEDLGLPDASATIWAEADDDRVLTSGATTRFEVTLSSEPCASDNSPVTLTTDCGSLTFSNPAGNPAVRVEWGDIGDRPGDTNELTLAPGAQRTVTTDAAEVFWFATDERLWGDEDDEWELSLGGTVPDFVATQADREELTKAAEFLDLVNIGDLGGGLTPVGDTCPAPTDGGTGTPSPTPTPEIPAVVQTDGLSVGDSTEG